MGPATERTDPLAPTEKTNWCPDAERMPSQYRSFVLCHSCSVLWFSFSHCGSCSAHDRGIESSRRRRHVVSESGSIRGVAVCPEPAAGYVEPLSFYRGLCLGVLAARPRRGGAPFGCSSNSTLGAFRGARRTCSSGSPHAFVCRWSLKDAIDVCSSLLNECPNDPSSALLFCQTHDSFFLGGLAFDWD